MYLVKSMYSQPNIEHGDWQREKKIVSYTK